MRKVSSLICVFIFFTQLVLAQGGLFEDKDVYIKDLKRFFDATKSQNTINIGNRFEQEVWNNAAIDDINKEHIRSISKKMLDKGYTANLQFTLMCNSLMAALQNQEMKPDLLLHFLETMEKTVDYQEVAVLNAYFQVSITFFQKRALFDYYNNSCFIKGGTFDFIYAGTIAYVPNENQDPSQEPPVVEEAKPIEEEAVSTDVSASILMSGSTQPTVEGPSIKFENIDIQLNSRFDTATIQKTEGTFMFANRLFVGNKGKFDWSILGNDVAEIYVNIKEYNFNTTNNNLSFENVDFYYPSKLENPIVGLFEFKSARRASPDKASYPRFTSLSNNVELKHLHKNIVYTGGFGLEGKRFSSRNLENRPASLFYNDGRNQFQTFANQYFFGDSVITSDPTSIIIFVGSDSIWHPGVAFTFQTNKEKVIFHRDRGPFKNSLFHDTYHKLEFSVDLVTWDLKSDSINFDIFAAKSQIPAMFKSMSYFSDKEFTKLQSINNFHPLRVLFNHMKITKSEILISEEILKKNKNITPTAFSGAMIDLKRKGFLEYEEISGNITLKPKAYHYMQSFIGKSDYDGIYIPSLSPVEKNATLDTKEYILKVRGVDRFYISDSSNVFAVPEDKIVKIFNDREVLYNGRLVAGIFDLKGRDFRFNYNDFLVSMEQIDTIKFIIQDDNAKEKKDKAHYLDNNLVYASGTMYVNKPDNKSGKKNLPEYPKFDASTGAYVYFNKKEILGGAYNRQVYFKIPPFKTDSVKGGDRKAIKFDGEFFSGDILPKFKETLIVMPDNSMGFKHKVPTDGYDVYGGKAKFYGTITLDHQGIRGDGELHYLSSKFYSNDFVFYRDSVIAQGQQAKIKESHVSEVYYPDVDIADYELKWVVKDDSMHLININHPFELYKKQISVEGSLNVTPKGLFGAGMMEIKKVNVIASHYEFKEENVEARHAVFNNKLPENPKPSISVNNMKINFYLKESYADLNPEIKGLASLEFPMNQFKTSIENARWDMAKKIITMDADENDLSKSFFYSTNPEDDSLVFNAAHATYDMTKNLIFIKGVPFIKVADTKIIPDSNSVTVYEDAQLKTLNDAIIIIDTTNGYHKLDKGKIEILSRRKFEGTARYPYINSGGDTMKIYFSNFYTDVLRKGRRDSVAYTSSDAIIKESEKFYIAPKILYKGKSKLIAPNKLLAFDGKVKIDLKAKGLRTDWFPYINDGTSGDVVIMLEKQKDKKEEKVLAKQVSEAGNTEENTETEEEEILGKLNTGLYYESGTNELYSAIVSTKRSETDEEVFSATGQLIFDTHTNSFNIGSPKKLKKEAIAGNYYSYNDTSSILIADGKFTLMKGDQNFGITSVGEARGSIAKNAFAANLLISLKMNMPPKALEIMAKKIIEITEIAPPLAVDSITQHEESMTMAKLANLENDKVAKEYDKNYVENAFYKPLNKYSSKLGEGICLSNVHMNWNHQHKAWHNKTHLKLSNILQTDINYKIKGYLEVKKSDNGDMLTLFLHPRSDVWFFINYQPGRLSLLSSEPEFVKAVTEKSKGESGTPMIYTFVQSDFTEKQQFLKEFWKNYLGKEYNEEEEEKEVAEQVEGDLEETAPTPAAVEATPVMEAVSDSVTAVPVKTETKAKKKEKKPKKKKDDITSEEENPAPVEPEKTDETKKEETPAPVEATPTPVEPEKAEEPKKEEEKAVEAANPSPVDAKPKKKQKKSKKKKDDITSEEENPAPVEPEKAEETKKEETPAPVEATPTPVEPEKTEEPKKEDENPSTEPAPTDSKGKKKKEKKK
jgi:hypothetical protein